MLNKIKSQLEVVVIFSGVFFFLFSCSPRPQVLYFKDPGSKMIKVVGSNNYVKAIFHIKEHYLHGKAYGFYPNKKIKWFVYYEKGLRTGLQYVFYPNGVVYSKTFFKDGLIEGVILKYLSNGRLEYEIPMKDNEVFGRIKHHRYITLDDLDENSQETIKNNDVLSRETYPTKEEVSFLKEKTYQDLRDDFYPDANPEEIFKQKEQAYQVRDVQEFNKISLIEDITNQFLQSLPIRTNAQEDVKEDGDLFEQSSEESELIHGSYYKPENNYFSNQFQSKRKPLTRQIKKPTSSFGRDFESWKLERLLKDVDYDQEIKNGI